MTKPTYEELEGQVGTLQRRLKNLLQAYYSLSVMNALHHGWDLDEAEFGRREVVREARAALAASPEGER